MRVRILALASAALLGVAACTSDGGNDDNAGVPVDLVEEALVLYSPESAAALSLGLPDQIGGLPLLPEEAEEVEIEEYEYAWDPRVRQILVNDGLDPERVTVSQKSARFVGPSTASEQIPPVALAAIQVKDVPAHRFIDWDASFYLLSTAVDIGDYEWQGEKPGDVVTSVAGREVSVADYTRFKVAWYPYGDVLYIIVAATDRLLEEAVERLPRPGDLT